MWTPTLTKSEGSGPRDPTGSPPMDSMNPKIPLRARLSHATYINVTYTVLQDPITENSQKNIFNSTAESHKLFKDWIKLINFQVL
jgi:hypothetical protein